MMIYYFLSFLIDEIWLGLQDNILYFPYLWETFHNRPSGRADWTFILGWHQKGLNADVERAEGFNGQASSLGFNEWACVFCWAWLFLGPGEWAYEPYFSKPIMNKIIFLYLDKIEKYWMLINLPLMSLSILDIF